LTKLKKLKPGDFIDLTRIFTNSRRFLGPNLSISDS